MFEKSIINKLGLYSLIAVLVFGLSACSPSSNIQTSAQYTNNYTSLSPQRQQLMKIAYQNLGKPYKWGGNNPQEGFDCSGLMVYSYQQSGITIPRTAAQQRDASQTLSRNQLIPGDMIFFKTGRKTNHVGIYIGNDEFIHASTSRKQVKKDKLSYPYWQRNFVKYGSFL